MNTTAMTGCARVNRMFARQDQDRVPRQDTYWPETIAPLVTARARVTQTRTA
jgi:hypothetical protein